MAGGRVVDRADIELSGFLLLIDREGDLVYEFSLPHRSGLRCASVAEVIVHVPGPSCSG